MITLVVYFTQCVLLYFGMRMEMGDQNNDPMMVAKYYKLLSGHLRPPSIFRMHQSVCFPLSN